ncbi:hypothetical protein [Chondromyces crocatus]|uniref:Uncharacterized protein n=1 Tax=Chondromyces crocatus TaxID=52 RepID=A0A0K1EFJ9_CHOCO|nr:hypothetical protein [Chondromyces crocatus]AKT39363.1 uncharacterized protein CMC5_035100 [Chondromyces crocatus]
MPSPRDHQQPSAPPHALGPKRLAQALTCTIAGLPPERATAWRQRLDPAQLAVMLFGTAETLHADALLHQSRRLVDGLTGKLVERALSLDSLRQRTPEDQERIEGRGILRALHLDEPELYPAVARTPLGFLSLRMFVAEGSQHHLQELIRIHVWEEGHRSPVENLDTTLHSHELSCRSFILHGEISNELYRVTPTDDVHAPQALYRTECDRDERPVFRNTQRRVTVEPVLDLSYASGSTYEVPLGLFHRNRVPAEAYTATLFYFGNIPGRRQSYSLGPADGLELGTAPVGTDDHAKVGPIIDQLCSRVLAA